MTWKGLKQKMNASIEPTERKQIENLIVQVYDDRMQMGQAAGVAIAAKMKELLAEKESVRMIFGSAPSQNEMLETLRADQDIDWKRVTAFHMDEYIGLQSGSNQQFSQYLKDQLFSHVDAGAVHFIDSSNQEQEECVRYSQLLNEGSIDIVCLGIGENGHLAFNDPPVADFQDPKLVKVVELDKVCRQQQVNDGCFATLHDVPTHAWTLTITTLLSGSYLYCVVPGSTKRKAVKRTLSDPISTEVPATILRSHPNCTLYLDRDSYDE